MHCMLCYEKLVSPTILGQRTKLKKWLVFYFKSSGITKLKKHVNGNHFLIARNFGKKIEQYHKKACGKTTCKERSTIVGMKFLSSLWP